MSEEEQIVKSQNNLLTQETLLKLESVFKEITDFFQRLYIKGLASLSQASLQDLTKFNQRLKDLGLVTLDQYLQDFIETANSVLKEKTNEKIKTLIGHTIRILTFMRVYERVQSKNVVSSYLERYSIEIAQKRQKQLEQKKNPEDDSVASKDDIEENSQD